MPETLTEAYDGHNLLFIVGCPRSGTTWLQRLLAGHPDVRTGQESDLFDIYLGPQLRAWKRELDPAASGRGGVGLGCYLSDEEYLRRLKTFAIALVEPMVGGLQTGQVFVEKTPGHVLWIPEILTLFPRARFVHVLRDARDVVASLLAASRSWGAAWAPRRAGSAAATWVTHVRAGRAALAQLPSSQVVEVRYEDLHLDTVRELRRVAALMRLDWSDAAMAAAAEANRPEVAKQGGGTAIPVGGAFAAASGGVVKEPAGFVRKARPESWREDLSRFEQARVWMVARQTMAETGYPWERPW